jgi:tetratricopeptide (TPR) repeat protein
VLPENAGPVGLRARRVKLPGEMAGTAFLVPFDSTTGAASFRTRDATTVVFDERRPLDLAALRDDPVFGGASVQLLSGGTLFRIPHPDTLSIALTQMPHGWRIAALNTPPKQQPIPASYLDGHLNLAAEQPGEVVSMADPDTGATLLVGTQHRPGQGTATSRRGSEFILRPTSQGVVAEPLSDSIMLKRIPTGFSLTGGPAGLALSPPTSATAGLMDAAQLTRRLDFSTIPPGALLRRATQQLGEAALAPPLARGPKHRAAAESLMALGLAAEAESLLHMAAEQDPKEAARADTGALTAIAALLAGRTDEAGALTDPSLDGTDEIALWRAVRQAMLDDGSPAAAAVFAATAPLAFEYPGPIREHILPLMAETMIQGGELTPAARLLEQRKSDPKLAYARALMRQAEGDTGQALGMLDALANGHDQFDRARAAIRAVELRLAARELDKTQAADALDKLLYAWRGDARELALRERIADLRGQTGAWGVALATLRQAETDFPEQAMPVHERLKDTFAGMIRDQGAQHIPPIEFVSMVDENIDLIHDAGDDEAVEQALADRLLALDLPGRAKPVLEKLMSSGKSGVAKARFGSSLAALEAREGDDAGARAALDASEAPDLPPELAEQRTIVRAGSVARLGDPAGAAAVLAPLRTGSATEARARILETAADWPGAEQAWADYVALTVPDTGMLDDTQARTVLRLVTATARAGDDDGLAALRIKFGERIGDGPLGDMFRLLTAEPVRTSADIGRSRREMSLAASLPADLKALHAGAGAQ